MGNPINEHDIPSHAAQPLGHLKDIPASEMLRYQKRQSDLMVSVLCHVIEFRSGGSGLHVPHIRILTKLLPECLRRIEKYIPKTLEQNAIMDIDV